MSLDIKKIKINNFLGEWNIDWSLNKVNVLVGNNGNGKTKLLNLIQALLERYNEGSTFNYLCNDAKIFFENGIEIDSYFLEDTSSKENDLMKQVILSNIDEIRADLYKNLESKNLKTSKDESDQIMDFLTRKFGISQEIYVGKKSLAKNKKLTRAFRVKQPNNLKNLDLNKDLKITYLSTVNMNANAINLIKKSDGEISTILDMEIQDELEIINKSKNKKLKNILVENINSFYSDTNKKIYFQGDSLFFLKDGDEKLVLSDLSSGERQLLFIFLKIVNCSDRKTLILMDEPEISLHLKWQENLIKSIIEINKNNQIIIVTHSPAIVMKGWLDSYVDINNIRSKV